jgi:uncharacterized protein YbaP (TraB family)
MSSSLFRKFLILAIACCALTSVGSAAENAGKAERATKYPKCCVWRVTNAKAPFYLVGSIHSLSPRDYPFPAPYDLALNDSKRLLFEFNPNESDAFSDKFQAAGKYPRGQDIRNKIHAKTLWWLREYTQAIEWKYNKEDKKYHSTVKSFDSALQYRPWWIANHFFTVSGYSDVTSKDGVDYVLETRAKKAGKELAGLESVDEHVAVMSGLTDLDGELLLLDTLVYGTRDNNDFHRARAAWRRGDTDKLWAMDARLRREAIWIARRLVDERNVRWIPRIEREIKTGKPTAIVAGAMHFSGPNSVVTLLQKRGYTVEQL